MRMELKQNGVPIKPQNYIGWDIGGAHLKVAQVLCDGSIGTALQVACPLWQGIDKLERAYHSAFDAISASDSTSNNTPSNTHIITMTGELSDGFDNRKQGVYSILDSMRGLLKQPFLVYASSEGILGDHNVSDIKSVASRNWQATAEWLASCRDEGVLMDMGSTTTDIVPFKSGQMKVQGRDDATRMQCGELIYTGISRTPIMAISDSFNIDGINYPIIAEHFATIADVYRILEKLDEDSDLYPACDNADKSLAGSACRLERMFGLDWAGDMEAVRVKARAIADVQQQNISRALGSLLKSAKLSSRACIIGAGSGYKIVQGIADRLGLQFMPYHQLLNNLPTHLQDTACYCATAISAAHLAYQKHL